MVLMVSNLTFIHLFVVCNLYTVFGILLLYFVITTTLLVAKIKRVQNSSFLNKPESAKPDDWRLKPGEVLAEPTASTQHQT